MYYVGLVHATVFFILTIGATKKGELMRFIRSKKAAIMFVGLMLSDRWVNENHYNSWWENEK